MLDEKKMINARYLNMLSIKYKVTHFDMVPSLYKEYLSIVSKQSALRFVLLAGEPLSIELVREHFNKYPSVRLVNEYGMAETCSCSFVKEMMPTDTVVTIGSPITNITYKIVDPDEDGVGELYIAGNGLAKGYRGNEAYTIEKFIYLDNVRHLKTGDYVREYGRGEIQFICRKDNQIKVNGKRINLQDINNSFDAIIRHIQLHTDRMNRFEQLLHRLFIFVSKNRSQALCHLRWKDFCRNQTLKFVIKIFVNKIILVSNNCIDVAKLLNENFLQSNLFKLGYELIFFIIALNKNRILVLHISNLSFKYYF